MVESLRIYSYIADHKQDRIRKNKIRSYLTPSVETSERMKKIPRSGTSIEKKMAAYLRGMGIKYRSQPKIKGNPDFRIVGKKIVLFCDSSFWHGRWLTNGKRETFKRNKEYWEQKIRTNKLRDIKTNRELKRRGWKVLRMWDDEINKSPDVIKKKLIKAVS